jgi:hypothetical protein
MVAGREIETLNSGNGNSSGHSDSGQKTDSAADTGDKPKTIAPRRMTIESRKLAKDPPRERRTAQIQPTLFPSHRKVAEISNPVSAKR